MSLSNLAFDDFRGGFLPEKRAALKWRRDPCQTGFFPDDPIPRAFVARYRGFMSKSKKDAAKPAPRPVKAAAAAPLVSPLVSPLAPARFAALPPLAGVR